MNTNGNEKRKLCEFTFKILQKIFSSSGTSIERIRDPAFGSSQGVNCNLLNVIQDIYKDDQIQPKTSELFYLQHFALKTWFAESKMGISQNIQMQTNILELFLQTNQRQINEWDRELMSLHMKKKIIGDDVKRFETNYRTCATFIQNLKRESITKSIETQVIEEMLRSDNDSSQDWKSLLVSKQCKEPRILKLVEKSKSYKAVGLFRVLEITRDPEVETKLFGN